MTDRVTASTIEVKDQMWWHLTADQRDELVDFIHAVSGHCRVFRVEYALIDGPVLTVHRYVEDENGSIQIDDQNPRYALRAVTDHLIRIPLPDWWTP